MTDAAAPRSDRAAALDAIVERTAALKLQLTQGVVQPSEAVAAELPQPPARLDVTAESQTVWGIPLDAVLPAMGLVFLVVAALIWMH